MVFNSALKVKIRSSSKLQIIYNSCNQSFVAKHEDITRNIYIWRTKHIYA